MLANSLVLGHAAIACSHLILYAVEGMDKTLWLKEWPAILNAETISSPSRTVQVKLYEFPPRAIFKKKFSFILYFSLAPV